MPNKLHIVSIEDEEDIQEIITFNLQRAGYRVSVANNGQDGLTLVQSVLPDLVLLDVMLPKLNGNQVCQHLKACKTTAPIPIIMLSAKSEETDIVKGLTGGADDYVTKPFSKAELLARIDVVLRRHPKTKQLTIKQVCLDLDKHLCHIDAMPIKLTATEFKLLKILMQQPSRAFTRDQLMQAAFGEQVHVVDRNIDVHIRAIRKALGDQHHIIETIRGIGYRCSGS